MQRRSVDLPLPEAPMSADDLVLGDRRGRCPRRTSSSPKDLWRPSTGAPAGRSAVARRWRRSRRVIGRCRRLDARSRSTSQSMNRASGIVTTRNTSAVARYGREVEVAACLICDGPEDLHDADEGHETVSFCSPMKSLSSGGMTRRTACGQDDVAKRLDPREPKRPSRGLLARVDRIDAGAVDLGHVRASRSASARRRPRGSSVGMPSMPSAGIPKPSMKMTRSRARARKTST